MKKLILVGAILVGVAATSQAGVSIRVGFGFSAPAPVVVSPAPVYYAPPVVVAAPACPPVYCAPPVVYTAPVCPPRVVVSSCPPVRYYYRNDWRGPSRGHGHGRW